MLWVAVSDNMLGNYKEEEGEERTRGWGKGGQYKAQALVQDPSPLTWETTVFLFSAPSAWEQGVQSVNSLFLCWGEMVIQKVEL